MINPSFISIVLPAFNEQNNIKHIIEKLSTTLNSQAQNYELIFVDDGSKDNTLNTLKEYAQNDLKVCYLSFSRNFGHQNALKAGLDHAKGDCVIFMDCDLQHPPELILRMLIEWKQGSDVVYTLRQDTIKTPLLKRLTATIFYSFMNFLSDVPIAQGRADFFLIDRKVADVLKEYNETPLFFRGMLPWLGFTQTAITYEPHERYSGVTKYSFKRMMEFAIDGITSFSIKPLRISIFCGISFSFIAFAYFIYAVYIKVCTAQSVSGWTSIMACVLLLGGIQLIMLGIIGEYLGKLFISSKKRPIYILKEKNLT